MDKIVIMFFLTFLVVYNANTSISYDQKPPLETPTQQADRYLTALQKKYAEGHYESHKAYSDSLLGIATKHNLAKMQVLAYTNQAVYFKNRGERLKAIELYHLALEKCDDIPEDTRAKLIVLVNMGNIYHNIGSYKKSIAYMEDVLQLIGTSENYQMIAAAALMGLGNNYAEFEDYDKSLYYYKKVKAIGEKIDNESVILPATNNISDTYITLKAYKKALAVNDSISNLAALKKPTKTRASFLLNTGVAHYYLKNSKEALLYLNECQELSKEKNILEIQMYTHEFLAKVYEQNGNFKSSVSEQKQYATIRELYLKDKKDASNADLNNEIDAKTETLAKQNKALEVLSKNKTIAQILGISMLFLCCILLYNVKRKKKLKVAQTKLQKQYKALQNDFSSLKNESTDASLSETSTEVLNVVKPYKNSSLTPQKRDAYKDSILAFMASEKPFLDPDMTQADLAEQLGISSHHFSEVLHYNIQQNFYNFINSYRILEAQNLMKSAHYKDAKIIAIAFDSGFKSKSTFNRIFKKHTGITPSEFKQKTS